MPIQWTVSHEDRLVVANVVDEVTREDFTKYLVEINAIGGMPYRKILDMTFAPLVLSAADIKAISRLVDEYGKAGPLGAFAIVVDAEILHFAGTMFGETSKAERPFAIFRRMAEARDWIDRVEPVPRG